MGEIKYTYEKCEVGHEVIVHKTVKRCPLCEESKLRNIVVLLRERMDATRNLCDERSRNSDTIEIADVLKTLSTD